MPTAHRMDWPTLARSVVPALRGDPTSKTQREWRWGKRGSLTLYLDTGSLYDFEADVSYRLLDFICRERGLPDRRAARQWLETQGYPVPLSTQATEIRPPVLDAHAEKEPPFWQTDLPRLDYTAIPDDPEHSLNRWAAHKCARPQDAAWPASCRWLRGWWGGDSVLAPLARPEAWLTEGGLMASAVQGIHAVHVGPDGRPREHRSLNKRTWCNRRGFPGRIRSMAGCGFLAGMPQAGDRLAICEGLADALALHWHLGIPALAACGSLAGLSPAAGALALLAGRPLEVQLQIWPDQDTRINPGTGLRAGSAGALGLRHALCAAGMPEDRITIMKFGRPDQDPCDWLADTRRHTHTPGANPS